MVEKQVGEATKKGESLECDSPENHETTSSSAVGHASVSTAVDNASNSTSSQKQQFQDGVEANTSR